MGRVIHPLLAEGQVEGGTLQAVGYATIEEIKLEDGRYLNDRLSTYLIPTSMDAPRITAILVEKPFSGAPHGAKGVGELPMNVVAPAIVDAIHDAVGRVGHGAAGNTGTRAASTGGEGMTAVHDREPTGPGAAYRFRLNGEPREVAVPGMRRLLDVLREDLGLTGTKEGCGEGECGACSVIVDGMVVDSCLVPICQVDGSEIRTVEGLSDAETGGAEPVADRLPGARRRPVRDLHARDADGGAGVSRRRRQR